jgi:hypothetical protein
VEVTQRNLCRLHREVCEGYTEKSVKVTQRSLWRLHREAGVGYTEKSVRSSCQAGSEGGGMTSFCVS